MAWSHLYGTISSGGANALLPVIRDFMLSVGWTLADDFITGFANPFFAMRSTGEAGSASHAVMIERDPLVEQLLPVICKTWDTITGNLWTPGSGGTLVSNGSTTMTAGGSAPALNSSFAIGDLVYTCNNVGNTRNNIGRMKVTNVTPTVLTVSNTGYPYCPVNIVSNSVSIITKGGPWVHAKVNSGTAESGRIICSSGTYYYYLFGDKDTIHVITRIGTAYNSSSFGRYTPYHQETTSVSTSEVTAGVSTSVDVEDGSLFTVGSYYQIAGIKNGHSFLVTSIVGNTLYFSEGLYSASSATVYPVGSKIGEDVFPLYASGLGSLAAAAGAAVVTGGYRTPNFNEALLNTTLIQGAQYQYQKVFDTNSAIDSWFNPDRRRNQYGFFPVWVGVPTDCRGQIRNYYYMKSQIGNSEDTIRLTGSTGVVYKIFQLVNTSGPWVVIKE